MSSRPVVGRLANRRLTVLMTGLILSSYFLCGHRLQTMFPSITRARIVRALQQRSVSPLIPNRSSTVRFLPLISRPLSWLLCLFLYSATSTKAARSTPSSSRTSPEPASV